MVQRRLSQGDGLGRDLRRTRDELISDVRDGGRWDWPDNRTLVRDLSESAIGGTQNGPVHER